MRALTSILVCLIFRLAFSMTISAEEAKMENIYRIESAQSGEFCTVCGALLNESDVAIFVHGRRFPVEKSMVETFLTNKEMYLRRIQARSALFQEELNAPAHVAQGGISFVWFLFGIAILAGLIFGGMSAYSAVSKDLPPIPCFLFGFFLNVFGYFLKTCRILVNSVWELQ